MRMVKHSLVLGTVFAGLLASPARAEERLDANVPFSFVVRGQEFPAGHYEIQEEGADVMLLRGPGNRAVIYALTIPADDRDPNGSQPALVFTRFENTYQLSEIWTSGSDGRAIESSSRPRRTKHAGMITAPFDKYVVGTTTAGDGL